MDVKDKYYPKENSSFEILPLLDSRVENAYDLEIIPLEFSSKDAINTVSSTLAKSITEETFPQVFDFSENLADSGSITNSDGSEESDDDFIKIAPLEKNKVLIQIDEDLDSVNIDFSDTEVRNYPTEEDSDKSVDAEIECRKPKYSSSAHIPAELSLHSHRQKKSSQEKIKPEFKHETKTNDMFETVDVPLFSTNKGFPRREGSEIRCRKFSNPSIEIIDIQDRIREHTVIDVCDSANANAWLYKALDMPTDACADKTCNFDSFEIARLTSLTNDCLKEDSVEGFTKKTDNVLLPDVYEKLNVEQYAGDNVLHNLGKDLRQCKPVNVYHGRSKCSQGICEAVFNSLSWCKKIKQSNFVKKIIDTAKTSIDFFLNAFEEEINYVTGIPRKITVIELLETGGTSISKAVAKGLRKGLEIHRFGTAYYGSEEELLPCPIAGIPAALVEARKRVESVRASGAIDLNDIAVATVLVLFESAEGMWQIATLLYLEDPRMPNLPLHCLTSSEPVIVSDGQIPPISYIREDGRRLASITAAAEILAETYRIPAFRSGLQWE